MTRKEDKEDKIRRSGAEELLAAFEEEVQHEHYARAIAFLRTHLDELYAHNPEYTIDCDLSLRIILHDFDGAYADLEGFQSLPYVRQSVEERLRDGKAYIRNAERDYYESLGKKKVKVESYDPASSNEQVSAFLSVKGKNDKPHIDYYLSCLRDNKRDNSLRSGALIRLIEIGYSEKVTFTKNGRTYTVIPANMPAPGMNPTYEYLYSQMQKKRFSEFSGLSSKLLSLAEINLFPTQLDAIARKEILLEAFYSLCLVCFQRDPEFPNEDVEEVFRRLYEVIFTNPYDPTGNMGQA